jgi:serine/threonine-protein kinase
VAFAAPEHVDSERFGSPGQSTDVYGLGALLYTLFAGRAPFSGPSSGVSNAADPHVVARRVESEAPTPPTDCDESLPDAVDAVVERAMAKRKPERYETVDDLRVALDHLVADHAPELREFC